MNPKKKRLQIVILGAGFVGKAIAKYYHNLGHTVTVTTTSQEKIQSLREFSTKQYLWHSSDSPKTLRTICSNADLCILCIAANTSDYFNAYYRAAKALIDAIQIGTKINHLCYTSSTSVYPESKGQLVFEENAHEHSEKAKILLDTEKILLQFPYTTIFRLGEIIGNERAPHKKLQHNNIFAGDGSTITNLVHVEDIVSACSYVQEKKLFGIFNLVNHVHISRKEYWNKVAQKYNITAPIWDNTKTPIHSANKQISSCRIESLGFTFTNAHYPFES